MPLSSLASEIDWPPLSYRIAPGTYALEEVGCFNKDALVQLTEAKMLCETYVLEARECKELAKKAVAPVDWFESKWFYLSLGLIAGGATVIAAGW